MSNLRTFALGVTNIHVGLSTTTYCVHQPYQNGWVFKKASGGTLAIVGSTNAPTTDGYIVGDSESINIDGPANFHLAAAGATCVVAAFWGYTEGQE